MPVQAYNIEAIDAALPKMHMGHRAVLAEAKRMNFLCAGRGWQKSTLLCQLAYYTMKHGGRVFWTAPNMANIEVVIEDQWRTIIGHDVWDACYKEKDSTLRLPGFASMKFKPLNEAKTGGHGGTPRLIIVDEAPLLREGIFSQVLQPMLSKDDKAVIWCAGTPNPDDPLNWFWRWATTDLTKPENRRIAHWTIPVVGSDLVENPVTKEMELVRIPSKYERNTKSFEDFKQEYIETPDAEKGAWIVNMLVKFRNATGDKFQNVERCCNILEYEDGDFPEEYFARGYKGRTRGWYQIGVDLAFSSDGDYTVIGVIDRETMKQVYFRRFRPNDYTEAGRFKQVYDVVARAYKLFPGKMYGDCTAIGNGFVEAMRSRGVPAIGINYGGSDKVKKELMGHLQDYVENQTVRFFYLPIIIREMMAMTKTIKETREGRQRVQFKSERKEINDDIPNAFGLMLYGIYAIEGQDTAKAVQVYKPPVSDIQTMLW